MDKREVEAAEADKLSASRKDKNTNEAEGEEELSDIMLITMKRVKIAHLKHRNVCWMLCADISVHDSVLRQTLKLTVHGLDRLMDKTQARSMESEAWQSYAAYAECLLNTTSGAYAGCVRYFDRNQSACSMLLRLSNLVYALRQCMKCIVGVVACYDHRVLFSDLRPSLTWSLSRIVSVNFEWPSRLWLKPWDYPEDQPPLEVAFLRRYQVRDISIVFLLDSEQFHTESLTAEEIGVPELEQLNDDLCYFRDMAKSRLSATTIHCRDALSSSVRSNALDPISTVVSVDSDVEEYLEETPNGVRVYRTVEGPACDIGAPFVNALV